jgi:PhnB protein
MHAEFTVLGTKLMCSDAFGHDAKPSEQISLMLMIDPKDAELGDRFYQHLVDSGEVTIDMPYATQFWGDKMGQVTDAFGVVWRLQQAPA